MPTATAHKKSGFADLRKCPACGAGRITVHVKAWVRFRDGEPVELGAARYPDTVTPTTGDAATCGDCLHHWRLTGPPAPAALDRFRPNHPAWYDLKQFLAAAVDYRAAVRRGDLTAAEAASARLAALSDPDAGDPDDRSYDVDEMGFFSSVMEEAIPSAGTVDRLIDDGDLPGALKELDHLIAYLDGTIDQGQPMRIVGWLVRRSSTRGRKGSKDD